MTDPFELLGIPARYDLDLDELATRQRDLSRALHPDRYAGRGASERRQALGKAIEVNEAARLLKQVVDATNIPVVSAGSIATFERINEVWAAGAWGFTIGSAFFDKQFVSDGSFEENVLAVCNWLEEQ